ncbi:MAG: nucleotidyl transferase AbiEii/AbiGii toxin family protein [bacterium]
MLNKENLEKFTKIQQTSIENIVREYCQHLFLSYLYQNPNSEKLLFKGGTALRIILKSPRFSEDLDFTGFNIDYKKVEALFADTLANIEKTGINVEIIESKKTTGGYLGIASFSAYGIKIRIQIEVSLRNKKDLNGIRILVENDYIPAYTIVHLPIEDIIKEKLTALFARQKPRDFYDYFFLLSGNYPLVKDKTNLKKTLKLLKESKINFRNELKKFLPVSHAMHFRDFTNILEQKILGYKD